MKDKILDLFLDFTFVVSGCVLFGFAITGVLIPNGLSAGGITGIARILQNYMNINYSLIYYVLAMCVLVVCFITLGWKDAKKILLMSILFPSILLVLDKFDFYLLESKDLFLSAIYFGVIGGVGNGLIFKRGFSFGGTDTIAKILKKKVFLFMSLSQILLAIDAIIIIISGFTFGRNIAMYALIAQLVYVKSIDGVLYGFGSKNVKIEIISEQYMEIEEYIMKDINRGVSKYKITGSYTGEEKIKITSICSPRETMLIKNFISKEGMEAFVSVIPINSVWGRGVGFANIDDDI